MSTQTKLALWAAAIAGMLVLGAWLGGMIFFSMVGLDPIWARPWTMIEYASYSDLNAYWIGLAVPAAFALGGVVLLFIPKRQSIYGDARWANEHQIRRAGLRAGEGVLLGKKSRKYLCTNEPAHTLVVAPTRSGKGVGVIIPNLLNFDGSVVVLDIKLENFAATSGFRHSLNHNVVLWAPMSADLRSHRFNPLDRIRRDPAHKATDLHLMASYLVPLPERDPIWDQLARSLFVALGLYVIDNPDRPATLGEIYRIVAGSGDLGAWANQAVANASEWMDMECARLLTAYGGMTDKEQSFVKTSLTSHLTLWSSPIVDAATSATDFDLGQIRRRRTSIYVGASQHQIEALRPLLSLFFQLAIGALAESLPGKDEPREVLFVLDEFASLGKMPLIASAVTMLAGHGGRLMFVLQGLGSLDEHYGKAGRETILQNTKHQIYFAPNDKITVDYVVERLGKRTMRQVSRSYTSIFGQANRNISETGRHLLLPQEVRGLPATDELVLVEGAPPVYAKKIRYYEDKAFAPRLLGQAPVPKLNLSGFGAAAAAPVEPEPVQTPQEQEPEAATVVEAGEAETVEAPASSLSDAASQMVEQGHEAAPSSSETDIKKALFNNLGEIKELFELEGLSVTESYQEALTAVEAL